VRGLLALWGHEPFLKGDASKEEREVHELRVVGALRINDIADGLERINGFLNATAKNSQKANTAARSKKYIGKRRR
jgi:hypothetical protein